MEVMRGLQSIYSATIDRSKFREIASRLVVFALPLFFWGRDFWWWGLIFVAAGLFIRAWGAGYLYKDQHMAAAGPYLLVRHPLYLGSCLLSLGLIVTIHHYVVTLLIGGITFLQYWHTIRHEERNLLARFGEEYAQLCRDTGPLWPKPAGIRKFMKSHGSFSFRQYMKNKEWEAFFGFAAVLTFLYLSTIHG